MMETLTTSLPCATCHAPIGQRCNGRPCHSRLVAAMKRTRDANRERREMAR